MAEQTLKPCPFCGGHAHWCMCDDEGCHRIECDGCQFQLDSVDEKYTSVENDTIEKLRVLMAEAWNRRTPEAAVAELITAAAVIATHQDAAFSREWDRLDTALAALNSEGA